MIIIPSLLKYILQILWEQSICNELYFVVKYRCDMKNLVAVQSLLRAVLLSAYSANVDIGQTLTMIASYLPPNIVQQFVSDIDGRLFLSFSQSASVKGLRMTYIDEVSISFIFSLQNLISFYKYIRSFNRKAQNREWNLLLSRLFHSSSGIVRVVEEVEKTSRKRDSVPRKEQYSEGFFMNRQERKQPKIVGVWESERFSEVESLEMSEDRVNAVLSSSYTLQFFIKAIYLSVIYSP